jgi:transposase InsO family protein
MKMTAGCAVDFPAPVFFGSQHAQLFKWAYLRFVAGLPVNRKRVYRLLKENGLLVRADTRLLAKRVSNTRKPRPERVNQWWGIDMTKIMTDSGWAYVVLVVDWYSKKVVGHYCGEQSKAWHWLAALNKAVMRQFPRAFGKWKPS